MPAITLTLPWLPSSSTTASSSIESILSSPTPPTHSERVLLAHHYTSLLHSYDKLTHRGQPLKLLLPCPSNPSITNAQFIISHARRTGGKAPYRTSAPLVGLTARAVRNWLYKGRALANQLDEGTTTLNDIKASSDNDIHYLKFYYDYREAEAQHRAKLEAETNRAALHGTEKIVTKELLVTDDNGNILARHEVIDSRTVTRDGKAAQQLLAIADPSTYAPKSEVKLTGSGEDGAIEVEHRNKGSLDLESLLTNASLETQMEFLKLMDKLKQASENSNELEKRARQQVVEVSNNGD